MELDEKDLFSDWRKLSRFLEQTHLDMSKDVSADAFLPTVGVKVELARGKTWFFEPRAYNAVWWWRDILRCQGDVRPQLVNAWALHIHLNFLQSHFLPLLKVGDKKVRAAIDAYRRHVRRRRDDALISVGLQLFSMREKLGWLIRETVGTFFSFHMPAHRVGFLTVLSGLAKLIKKNPGSTELARYYAALAPLDSDEVRRLMQMRHGFTHRLRPRFDDVEIPLMVQDADGLWDSASQLKTYARHILHAATRTWTLLVDALREIARSDLVSHLDVQIRQQKDEPRLLPYHLHLGRKVRVADGFAVVRCLRRCRGFAAEMAIPAGLSRETIKKNYVEPLSATLRETVSPYDPEKHGGKILAAVSPSAVLLMLREEFEEYESFSAEMSDLPNLAFAQVSRESFFEDWAEDAKSEILAIANGNPISQPVVVKRIPGHRQGFLVFRSRIPQFDLSESGEESKRDDATTLGFKMCFEE